jgi:hypothetical protein
MEAINLEIADGEQIGMTLKQLSKATGPSVPFWKKEIYEGRLPATKAGALTIVLVEDVREYLLKNRRVRGKAA